MKITKTPSFFCNKLSIDIVLNLTYIPSPGNAQADVITEFNCKNVCVECGVIQKTKQNGAEYNWVICPAHQKYIKQ